MGVRCPVQISPPAFATGLPVFAREVSPGQMPTGHRESTGPSGKKMDSLQGSRWLVGVREELHKVTVQELQFSPRFLFTHLFVLFFNFFARVFYLAAEPFVDVCR